MKATMEISDELYRMVKAKSALEGRAIREVAEELFRRYVTDDSGPTDAPSQDTGRTADEALPSWFGILRKSSRRVDRHDMNAIRESIARGLAAERGR